MFSSSLNVVSRGRALGALVAAGLSLAAPFARAADVSVIVAFHGNADAKVLRRHGGKTRADLGSLRAFSGRIPLSKVAALRRAPGVAYVEEDMVRQATLNPNDTFYGRYQADDFGLIRCPSAWDRSRGAGVRVAVLDTGCQLSHPDIGSASAGKVKAWKNFTSSGAAGDVTDVNGHGTHTAGTVGARMNNGSGVAAAGFDCELAIGKVLGNNGSGYDSWIAGGMMWATDTARAKVISLSLGSAGGSSTMQNAVNYAWARNVVVVAAAGNDGSRAAHYPAAYSNCISVAAVDNRGTMAGFSNFGPTVDLAAPGVGIASTYRGSSYALMSGTSMATPHVAGVAALVWARMPGASGSSVRSRMMSAARQSVMAPDGSTNIKLVDAYAAVGSNN